MRHARKHFAYFMTQQQQTTARMISSLILLGVFAVLLRASAGLVAIAIVATVALVSFISRRILMRRVSYWRKFEPQRAFQGEEMVLWCNLANRSWLPAVSVYVDDTAPKGFECVAERYISTSGSPQAAALPAPEVVPGHAMQAEWVAATTGLDRDLSQRVALLPHERFSRGVRMRAKKRGYFTFEPPHVRLTDVLGLLEGELHPPLVDTVIVYPRVYALEDLPLRSREPFGALPALRTLVEDPLRIVGTRDYAYGDSFRQVDWKSTARRSKLQTRVVERASEPSVTIVLNVSTFTYYWEGIEVNIFEAAVSLAASFAKWAHEQGWAIGISSNGNAPQLQQIPRVRARRSPNQLARVLESLAAIGPHFFYPLEEFLFFEQRFLPASSTQLIVTPIMNVRIEDALRKLSAQGKSVILVCIGCAAPFIEGVVAMEMPLEPLARDFQQGGAVEEAAGD